MNNIKLRNIGQIVDADINFGDLTVFVGPQATGKSVTLQFLKLVVDIGNVQDELARHGLDWNRKLRTFLDVYLGEGMQSIWRKESRVIWSGKRKFLSKLVARKHANKKETLFYIPAQRVLTLRDGWPRPFTDYSPGDPFAVRAFSERLRMLMEREFSFSERIFPQERRLGEGLSELLNEHVFSGFELKVDRFHSQKRLVLSSKDTALPYMVWSAGQREFVPLLLSLYWLLPRSGTLRRNTIKWVVLEEPEMGLHPRALTVVLLLIFRLMQRGYRVCISTHSPQILEAIWALRQLRLSNGTSADVMSAFGAPSSPLMQRLGEFLLKAKLNVFYFDRSSGHTKDISNLDPSFEEQGDSGWGGLTEFSGRVNAVVADTIGNS